MSSTIQTSRSQTEQKAIKLLGGGYSPGTVATAVGVSESRISQLLSDPSFAAEVSELRFQNLNKHNELDAEYDAMEKQAAKQLKEMLPLIMRPGDLLKATAMLNNMKRRGQSAPEQMVQQNQVVNLLMPVMITQKFTTNVNNQVISAGNQTLETIQGSVLLNAAKAKSQLLEGLHNEQRTYTQTTEVGSSVGERKESPPAITNSESNGRPEQATRNGSAAIYESAVPR